MQKLATNLERDKKFSIFEIPTGGGKCFAPGTPILMFDGTIRSVETIKVGEQVMGPDSQSRTVLGLSNGVDEMFRVTPTKGDPFEINSQHILTLQMTPGSGYLTGRSRGQRGPTHPANPALNAVVNLSVGDYLDKPRYWKHCAKAYRVGVSFPARPVPVDPYFLGLWLGDGDSDQIAITSMDTEVVECIRAQAEQLGLGVTPYSNGSKATSYNLTTQRRGGRHDRNPLLNSFKSLGVINNKHVPHIYKCNSRDVRLALLAGYLDTDGYMHHGGFEFVSILPRLAEDIAYLARSLGFACYVGPCHKASQNGTVGTYYRGYISGDISIIPVRITRKVTTQPRGQVKSVLRTGIQVTPIGPGAYFGFSVDGDHLFLLGDFTVVHNSGIALSAITTASSGAILTPQKILQEQYAREFGHLGLADLRGGSNYKCTEHEDTTCDIGGQLNRLSGNICASCPYRAAKGVFSSSKIGVTNFSYFLTDSAFKEKSQRLADRELLVIDEAHNTENVLIAHSEIVVTPARLDEIGVKLPARPFQYTAVKAAKEWVDKILMPAADTTIAQINLELKSPGKSRMELLPLARKITHLEQFVSGLRKFVESESDMWFIDQSEGGLNIKPLRGDVFAEELLFSRAKSIVLMSATILDPATLIRNLGIDRKDCGYLSLPSEFPIENRPVIFAPAGSMSFKNYDDTLPKLLKRIERVLIKHPEEKGIIHCNSFKLMTHIKEYFRGSVHGPRLLDHDSKNRGLVVEQHNTSLRPTVLLSPSMTEGLDLRDDLSRFQVVAKAPFLSLASPFIRARMDMDAGWYQWCAALALVQACGRSVRSKEDFATTYLLDADIMRLLKSGLLPDWWLSSVEFR